MEVEEVVGEGVMVEVVGLMEEEEGVMVEVGVMVEEEVVGVMVEGVIFKAPKDLHLQGCLPVLVERV